MCIMNTSNIQNKFNWYIYIYIISYETSTDKNIPLHTGSRPILSYANISANGKQILIYYLSTYISSCNNNNSI